MSNNILHFFYVNFLKLISLFIIVVLLYTCIYNVILYYPLCSKVLYKSNLFYDYCVMYVLLKLALTDLSCVKFLLSFTIDH